MREIKFRAWDVQNKIMHNEFEFIRSGTDGNDWILFKSDKQKIECGNVLNNPYFQQQIKVMQYTGLKDKNGLTEIYEGDIIDENGLVKGNIYEINEMDKRETDTVIQGFGTKTWCQTVSRAILLGCRYSE